MPSRPAAVGADPTPTARRKPPEARRAEMITAASALALSEGLDRVTARRVADTLGVFPGLVSHYFGTADDLVAAAFGHAAAQERDELFARAERGLTAKSRMRRLLAQWLAPDRDALSLLWLDAWQASRRRPALLAEVSRQMELDTGRLAALIEAGVSDGQFHTRSPSRSALRIMAMVDGFSVQAAVRTTIDYDDVRPMVLRGAERELGLADGTFV
ncbi:TetR family transcriptional regulator C-terminal domain-containing protein [Jatrophihabitans telluris]|uniref:TetR family transcriptional regulator C-terminal domain-containing protein n=1 Tax=Jatrophihabitans telluris TaxID=2038343 RepID=A0ABY4R0L0_9ACTN|nr:TetR family transcriptional regulator C-terminal domain-containing protein [Jatrophihabitans telluris]UQX89128.1 TetR family transcriptional regulator C-terminal domain-containing protein [Jatrophihabitans telluris]